MLTCQLLFTSASQNTESTLPKWPVKVTEQEEGKLILPPCPWSPKISTNAIKICKLFLVIFSFFLQCNVLKKKKTAAQIKHRWYWLVKYNFFFSINLHLGNLINLPKGAQSVQDIRLQKPVLEFRFMPLVFLLKHELTFAIRFHLLPDFNYYLFIT